MKHFWLFFFSGWMSCLLPTNALHAQHDSLIGFVREPQVATPPAQPVFWNDSRFNLEMGLDVYTAYGLNDTGNELPGYFHSYNRQGEVNLNLGYLRGSYTDNRFKAHLGLMAGTYANANMAAEPGSLRNLLEAYVGVALSEASRTWIEAGVFDSHIGFESPIGFDQLALTRGLLSENTPYYLSGVRLLHRTKGGKLRIGLLVLNGWQMIQKPYDERIPALGHTLTYFVNDRLSLHSNSYAGPQLGYGLETILIPGFPFEIPGAPVLGSQLMHNFYAKCLLSDRIEVIAGCDAGLWHEAVYIGDFSNARIWYAPSLVVAYKTGEQSRVTLRLEHFNDQEGALVGVIGMSRMNPFDINLPTVQAFVVTGASINYDYDISSFAKWRIEARGLYSQESVFQRLYGSDETESNTLIFFTTSLSVRLFK